jgi:hypothetical protein
MRPQLCVLFTSGDSDDTIASRALRDPGVQLLGKP